MAWSIDYNGYGSTTNDWRSVNITDYQSTAVFANDGITQETTRHELTGTAVINGATAGNFQTAIIDARSKLQRQGKKLVIQFSGFPIADIDGNETDDYLGTPQCDVRFERIAGERAAVVGFKFTWHDYEVLQGEDTTYHVMSHWWTQRFDIGENGLQVYFVNGQLKVRADAPAGTGVAPKLGPNPDAYRNLVMPLIPIGFRIRRQDWATDVTGQQLIYSIELEEHARDLPSPAKRGDGTFSYRRTLDGGPGGGTGVKVFEAELEGDKDASPALLLDSLVRSASTRIKFTGTGGDEIRTLEIQERSIYSKKIIALRVVAKSYESLPGNPGVTNPNFNLLDSFFGPGQVTAEPPTQYGATLIRSVRRLLFAPASGYTDATFPIAQTENQGAVEGRAYTAPDSLFTSAKQIFDPGPEAELIKQTHRDFPYVAVSVRERVEIRPKTEVLKSQSQNGKDRPYQLTKPDVFLVTEYEVIRQGQPPPRVFLSAPSGTVKKDETFTVSPGKIDANDNRQFGAAYRRVLQLMDIGQNGWADVTTSVPGLGNITTRTFQPPNNLITFPFDPKTESDATGQPARDVFSQYTQNTTYNYAFTYTEPDVK